MQFKMLYVTPCSEKKYPFLIDVADFVLYRSIRIPWVRLKAYDERADFMILSGRRGLRRPTDIGSTYKYLLEDSAVGELAQTVAEQLRRSDIDAVKFFCESDQELELYRRTMREACAVAGKQFIDVPIVKTGVEPYVIRRA